MDIVFLSPAYPAEMQQYTRGLHEVGARVHGVGDQPLEALPRDVRARLTTYLQVPRLLDEADVVARVRKHLAGRSIDRVEALWEPLVLTAARLREAIGAPGMTYEIALRFRDKERMKEVLRQAGLRVPHSARIRSRAEAQAAAARIGFPLILKPISGAGSADTYRVNDAAELDVALARMGHVVEASCEEFVEGEEFTYDTICIDGTPVYENVAQYLPRPLDARSHEWISPIIITVSDLRQPTVAPGIAFGREVMKALGMDTGFTHMEWYRKANGEIVFGEIGARPGGAHLVDQMNYTSDVDLFREWARAVTHGRFEGNTERRYNVAIIFKRAIGHGRITRREGLDAFLARYRPFVCSEQILPVGAQRRDWMQTLVSDGFVILRHPQWAEAKRMAEEFATGVTLYAGG